MRTRYLIGITVDAIGAGMYLPPLRPQPPVRSEARLRALSARLKAQTQIGERS